MTMHSENYCNTIDELDRVDAVRAIHEALLQIEAGEIHGFDCLDMVGLKQNLRACLKQAGHVAHR